MSFTLVIHGGAGNITPAIMNKEQEADYHAGLKEALDKGYEILKGGGRSLDAGSGCYMHHGRQSYF
jgi:beta-aspartyl-peptidase (threonine type)